MAVGGQHHTPTASPRVCSPVPSMQEAGLAPGPVFTGTKKRKSLCPTGVRTPNRTVRSESLYQPRYPGPPMEIYATVKLALPFLLESPPSLLLRTLTITAVYVWCTLSSCWSHKLVTEAIWMQCAPYALQVLTPQVVLTDFRVTQGLFFYIY